MCAGPLRHSSTHVVGNGPFSAMLRHQVDYRLLRIAEHGQALPVFCLRWHMGNDGISSCEMDQCRIKERLSSRACSESERAERSQRCSSATPRRREPCPWAMRRLMHRCWLDWAREWADVARRRRPTQPCGCRKLSCGSDHHRIAMFSCSRSARPSYDALGGYKT